MPKRQTSLHGGKQLLFYDAISEFLTFAKTSSLQGLQARARSTTSHSVGDTVSILMDDEVVLQRSVTIWLKSLV